jgi:hypothetical protein
MIRKKLNQFKRLLISEIGKNAVEYINNFINFSKKSTFYTSTITRFNIDKLPSSKFTNIVNFAAE